MAASSLKRIEPADVPQMQGPIDLMHLKKQTLGDPGLELEVLRLFDQLDRSKVTTARVQARGLETALETMRVDINRYPTQAEGLALLMQADPKAVPGWAGPYLGAAVPNDPWGKPYIYEAPKAENQPPAVISLGADGKPGGTGNSADVRNTAGT